MSGVSALLPAAMFTLVVCLATAQDVVNCSSLDVSSFLQSVRAIEISTANKTEKEDSSQQEDEVSSSDSNNCILKDLVHALEAVESQTIDLSPPKDSKYKITCIHRGQDEKEGAIPKLKKQMENLTKLCNATLLIELPWLRCVIKEPTPADTLEEILHAYVDPVMNTVIFTLGFVWNGVLVLIFVRQKQLWTPPNVMLFNLALSDLISLLWNVACFCLEPLYKKDVAHNELACTYHVITRPMSIALSALSVAALSILRYIAIVRNFTLHTQHKLCMVSTKMRYFCYLLLLWLLALGLAYPYTFMVKYTPGKCDKYGHYELARKLITSEFVLYCVVLPAVMVAFNTLTVRKLKKSVRNLSSAMKKNRQEAVRHRSANMLMVFMAIFLVTYVPHYILRLLRFWDIACDWQLTHLCLYKASYYLLFSNLCFNPISLYLVSGTFRTHYNYYFTRMCRTITRRQVAY